MKRLFLFRSCHRFFPWREGVALLVLICALAGMVFNALYLFVPFSKDVLDMENKLALFFVSATTLWFSFEVKRLWNMLEAEDRREQDDGYYDHAYRTDSLMMILTIGLLLLVATLLSNVFHASQNILDVRFDLSVLYLTGAITFTLKECYLRFRERKRTRR